MRARNSWIPYGKTPYVCQDQTPSQLDYTAKKSQQFQAMRNQKGAI
ncbi:BQ5605_C054g12623 [Microbotryum silenes-dioicae]|uniref:BQ5605_C034g11360 protein n=1 Tax=Microbotryum silenes-dioicae TaxID=796604 RepID=A0A2X0NUX8_9BASI|nr:BQ5605_C121g13298 [Microbotryum silenes-dioicae]SGZ00598.1 BQ5605_C034g11360 [Microbotryum silenes-dioicae]SGZ29346.1 BQ5605_C054g12623 [Microbotryum silenes-dioicae]